MEKDLPQTVHTGRGLIFFGFRLVLTDLGEGDLEEELGALLGEVRIKLGDFGVVGIVGVAAIAEGFKIVLQLSPVFAITGLVS